MAVVDSPTLDPMSEIGASGLLQFGGVIQEDSLRELQGLRGIKTYKEMSEQDPVIAGTLFALEMLCRRVTWHVDPFDENAPADVEDANFVDECLNDMSSGFEDMLTEILTVIPYGWAYLEQVYKLREGPKDDGGSSKYNDGKVGWRKWALRSQDTLLNWDMDETGAVKGMVQQAPPLYRTANIPIEKALLFRTTARKGNPEGKSALRGAYRPWYFKKQIETIEAIGVERDLAGLPVAWLPPAVLAPSASAEQKALYAAVQKIVTNIRRDDQEGVIFPLAYDTNGNKVYDLTLLSTGGTRQFNTDTIVSRYDSRIAMTVLADFILLGHANVGSWALSSSKTNLFSYALGSFLDMIADVINRHAIPRLFRMNGKPVDRLPKLAHGDIETVDLQELGAFVTALTGAGVAFDSKAVAFLLEQGGIPHDPVDQIATKPVAVFGAPAAPQQQEPPQEPPNPDTPDEQAVT